MTRHLPEPPDDILALARARAAARASRDWPRADARKAEIEAAGWKVIDRGTDFRLEPATPPTVEDEGVVRYGSAAAVPSVLEAPPSAAVSVVALAEDHPADLARLLAGLRAHAPNGTHVVVVANAPSADQADRLVPGSPDVAPIAGEPPEVAWTSARLGHAAARNVGLRRARGAIVVLADAATEPTGDALAPLVAALADPTVAVAGAAGFVTPDLRRFEETGGLDVDVVDAGWLAFRRAEIEHGGPSPLDEKIVLDAHLGAWWSLVLRAGPDPDAPPRRAIRLDLPLVRHERPLPAGLSASDLDRLGKRAFYRLLDRFGYRPELRSGRR